MVGLSAGGAALVLEASEGGASGVSLVLSCTGIEGLLEDLADRGVKITKQLWEGHWGARLASFKDPEGNTIHLEEPAQVEGRTP